MRCDLVMGVNAPGFMCVWHGHSRAGLLCLGAVHRQLEQKKGRPFYHRANMLLVTYSCARVLLQLYYGLDGLSVCMKTIMAIAR